MGIHSQRAEQIVIGPGEDVRFRPMCEADLERVVENELRAYAFPWTRGLFRDCLRGREACWVVESRGEVIGHGIFSMGAGEAHLLNVCVARDHQGRGLGRQLVMLLLREMACAGVHTVFLEVRPSNHVAGRLYESLGFNEIGRRRDYYPTHNGNEDARVLALSLTADWPPR